MPTNGWRPHIRAVLFHRLRFVVVLALMAATGCHRGSASRASAPADAGARPFVGWIVQTRGQQLTLDEDASRNVRRAEVYVSPTTEITLRDGTLRSLQWLRPGVRVTVWFTDGGTYSGGIVRATAHRVVVDQ